MFLADRNGIQCEIFAVVANLPQGSRFCMSPEMLFLSLWFGKIGYLMGTGVPIKLTIMCLNISSEIHQGFHHQVAVVSKFHKYWSS